MEHFFCLLGFQTLINTMHVDYKSTPVELQGQRAGGGSGSKMKYAPNLK